MIELLAGDPIEEQVAWENPALEVVPVGGVPREFVINAASRAVTALREVRQRDGSTSAMASRYARDVGSHLGNMLSLGMSPEDVTQVFSEADIPTGGLRSVTEVVQENTDDSANQAGVLANAMRLSNGGMMTSDEQVRAQAIIAKYKADRTPSLKSKLDSLNLP